MKRLKSAGRQLPTLMCAWCHGMIRPAGPKISHGICRPCAQHWFGKLAPTLPRPLAT